MIKNVIPLGDRVLIKPLEEGEKKYGQILIATSEDRPEIGEVVAVGSGRTTEFGIRINEDDCPVQVGDTVMIPKIGTIRVEVDGTEMYLTPFKEILGKVELSED